MDYLVVDMERALDESRQGKAAAEQLHKRWEMAQKEYKKLLEQAANGDEEAAERAEELEEKVPDDLAEARQKLQHKLSAKAKDIIAVLAAKRGVSLVLASEQVLAFAAEAEITDAVIAALDN